MKQDMIVILDLGSVENTTIARQIRDLGVYSEIYPHDITAEEIRKLPNVKGIILSGGENRVVDGAPVEISHDIYDLGIPMISIDHPTTKTETRYSKLIDNDIMKTFVYNTCNAEANWNMKNFVDDQIQRIRDEVKDKKVLLALSGGVDSSVVAALLIKAIGKQLV
ncbi:MAG: glutamine-hydrolyzing GMP synthase, partial [Erysipelotrichales bacterium]